MTADELKKCRRQLSSGSFNIQPVLQEIGEELYDNPRPDAKYLVELDIFLRELHKTVRSGKKDLYTTEIRDLLILICAKASYIAENANNTRKGEKFYKDLQRLGQLLIDNSSNFQAIISLVLLINPDMKFFI